MSSVQIIKSGATVSLQPQRSSVSLGTARIEDENLVALAGLTGAADTVPYFTGVGAMAVAPFTAYGRSVVAAASAAAARAVLGLVAIAASGSASDLTSGLVAPARGGTGADLSAATVGRLPEFTAGGVLAQSLIQDGVTAGVLTFAKTGTTPRTATLPDADITVAGINLAQTWSAAQTLTASSNSLAQTVTVKNSTAGTAAGSLVAVSNDADNGASIRSYSSVFSGSIHGITAANLAYFSTFGSASSALAFGTALNIPVHFTQNSGLRGTISATEWKFNIQTMHADGTAAAPGIRLTSEASGLYRVSSTAVGVSVAGALVLTVGSTASSFASGTTVTVSNSTVSTSTSTGALVVTGGVGAGGQATVRRIAYATGTISTTGAIASLASDDGLTRLTGAAPDIQGIANPGTSAARVIFLYCVNATTIRHENATAAAADRITSDTGADISVAAGKCVKLIYDPTSSRWRPVRY